jgi:hypothetical protein
MHAYAYGAVEMKISCCKKCQLVAAAKDTGRCASSDRRVSLSASMQLLASQDRCSLGYLGSQLDHVHQCTLSARAPSLPCVHARSAFVGFAKMNAC